MSYCGHVHFLCSSEELCAVCFVCMIYKMLMSLSYRIYFSVQWLPYVQVMVPMAARYTSLQKLLLQDIQHIYHLGWARFVTRRTAPEFTTWCGSRPLIFFCCSLKCHYCVHTRRTKLHQERTWVRFKECESTPKPHQIATLLQVLSRYLRSSRL